MCGDLWHGSSWVLQVLAVMEWNWNGQITPTINSPWLKSHIRKCSMTICDISWLLDAENNENGGQLGFRISMRLMGIFEDFMCFGSGRIDKLFFNKKIRVFLASHSCAIPNAPVILHVRCSGVLGSSNSSPCCAWCPGRCGKNFRQWERSFLWKACDSVRSL